MNILEIRDLQKSFGGVRAVRSCSFTVESGRITALIGPNGAGKTTVFNIVNGFLGTDSGDIVLAGHSVKGRAAWERSRLGMSRTFQLSRLFRNLSIRDNLLLALRADDSLFWRMFFRHEPDSAFDARIIEAMKLVGLRKDVSALAAELSYGEQKLFDLARAFINPHTILLLDEPVAGVNPVIREKLRVLMHALKQRGETMLLIEHDMDFVRSVADWVIVMVEGTVLTQGEPERVLRERQVLEAYLGVQ